MLECWSVIQNVHWIYILLLYRRCSMFSHSFSSSFSVTFLHSSFGISMKFYGSALLSFIKCLVFFPIPCVIFIGKHTKKNRFGQVWQQKKHTCICIRFCFVCFLFVLVFFFLISCVSNYIEIKLPIYNSCRWHRNNKTWRQERWDEMKINDRANVNRRKRQRYSSREEEKKMKNSCNSIWFLWCVFFYSPSSTRWILNTFTVSTHDVYI